TAFGGPQAQAVVEREEGLIRTSPLVGRADVPKLLGHREQPLGEWDVEDERQSWTCHAARPPYEIASLEPSVADQPPQETANDVAKAVEVDGTCRTGRGELVDQCNGHFLRTCDVLIDQEGVEKTQHALVRHVLASECALGCEKLLDLVGELTPEAGP